jgi:hypothetical protein
MPCSLASWPTEMRQQCGQFDGVHAGCGTLVSFSAKGRSSVYELLLSQAPSPGNTRSRAIIICRNFKYCPAQPSADRSIFDYHRQLLIRLHPSDFSRQGSSAPDISRYSISTQIFTNKMSLPSSGIVYRKEGRINDTVGVRYSRPRYNIQRDRTPLLLHALISGVSVQDGKARLLSEGEILRGLNEHVREATNFHVCYLWYGYFVTVEGGRPF